MMGSSEPSDYSDNQMRGFYNQRLASQRCSICQRPSRAVEGLRAYAGSRHLGLKGSDQGAVFSRSAGPSKRGGPRRASDRRVGQGSKRQSREGSPERDKELQLARQGRRRWPAVRSE
eukprot:44619-Pyramimonas_sp.AAC.1